MEGLLLRVLLLLVGPAPCERWPLRRLLLLLREGRAGAGGRTRQARPWPWPAVQEGKGVAARLRLLLEAAGGQQVGGS